MKGPKLTDGLSIPRHVQLPPELVSIMPYMSKAEFRVIIAVLSYGGDTPLPFSELQRTTGLSRPSVSSGIKDAIERGTLERVPVATDGGQSSFAYSVRYNTLSPSQSPAGERTVLGENDANASGKVFLPPALLKLSFVVESLNLVKQQYLTTRAGGKVFLPLSGSGDEARQVSRRALDKALKSAGVYYSARQKILENAFRDTEYAERVVWALVLYPLALELGLANGAGWLVTAITSNWNFQEMAEDYLERLQARAAQRTARESLPADILQMLEKIGWASGFAEIATAFQEDPRRVRGLLLEAVEADDREHAAAHFRQALRSGAQPGATTLYRLTILEAADA